MADDIPSDIPPSPEAAGQLDRRDFLKLAGGVGAGLLVGGATGCASEADKRLVPGLGHKRRLPLIGRSNANIVVIGAGAWGGWTAYYLRKAGANVTLVDQYGPGNSRSSSGDESRGIRSSYGDKEDPIAELWMRWARESMLRWKSWEEEWGKDFGLRLFYKTGDFIFRTEPENFTTRTIALWKKLGIPYELPKPEDVRKEYPSFAMDDINVVLFEPDAGVVRARRSCQAVVAVFEKLGGKTIYSRARITKTSNGKVNEIALDEGTTLRADAFVFCCGPWLGKMFPELLGSKMRVPLGYVCYFGTPVGDHRFAFPNMPSWNFPGVTGWPALADDSRGFRVRGGVRAPRQEQGGAGTAGSLGGGERSGEGAGPAGGAPGGAGGRGTATAPQAGEAGRGGAAGSATPTPPQQLDPDTSDRWADETRIAGPRRFLELRFPTLKDAPILQTHACHYEATSSRNFIIDEHPQLANVWVCGGGNAEGFKQGPTVGEYIAQRVLGDPGDEATDANFKIPEADFPPPRPP